MVFSNNIWFWQCYVRITCLWGSVSSPWIYCNVISMLGAVLCCNVVTGCHDDGMVETWWGHGATSADTSHWLQRSVRWRWSLPAHTGNNWISVGTHRGSIGTHWRHTEHTGQGGGPLLGSCHLVISPHTAPGHHPLGAGLCNVCWLLKYVHLDEGCKAAPLVYYGAMNLNWVWKCLTCWK